MGTRPSQNSQGSMVEVSLTTADAAGEELEPEEAAAAAAAAAARPPPKSQLLSRCSCCCPPETKDRKREIAASEGLAN